MKQFLKKQSRRPGFIPVLCYGAVLVGWLLCCSFGAIRDTVLQGSGKLVPFTIQMEDFTAVNMELTAEGWHTLSDDPQLHWENPDGRAVRTVCYSADFSKPPREMCLYYTTRQGEDFSQEKRVFVVQQADGSYLYALPAGNITALRLDPCSARNLVMKMESAACNASVSPMHVFVPTWYGIYMFAVWPALASAALSLIAQAIHKVSKRRDAKQKCADATEV